MGSIESFNRECRSAKEDDQDLSADNDNLDQGEPSVPCDSFKNIEFVIDAPATRWLSEIIAFVQEHNCQLNILVLIENLHPHKSVEYDRLHRIMAIVEYLIPFEE